MKTKIGAPFIFLVVAIVVVAAGTIGYVEYRNAGIQKQFAETAAVLASMNSNISVLNDSVGTLASQDQNIVSKLDSTKLESLAVIDQISRVSATVSSIDKLSKTDEELLQKYSKVYFLNEHYIPPSLSIIESQYVYDKSRSYQIHAQVLPHLVKMIDAAKQSGKNILVASSYRSFGSQTALKQSYKVTYGAGTANTFSADQGYSEHQLGTTVDFTTPTLAANFEAFENTAEYTWLKEHAHEYGFTLSYPQNNAYYKYEPWHWRYVGVDLASRLHREGKYFYDYDQRAINDYLLTIFD